MQLGSSPPQLGATQYTPATSPPATSPELRSMASSPMSEIDDEAVNNRYGFEYSKVHISHR